MIFREVFRSQLNLSASTNYVMNSVCCHKYTALDIYGIGNYLQNGERNLMKGKVNCGL